MTKELLSKKTPIQPRKGDFYFLFKFIITVPKQKSVTKIIYTYR